MKRTEMDLSGYCCGAVYNSIVDMLYQSVQASIFKYESMTGL